jgi:propanediol dehydratase small subunit
MPRRKKTMLTITTAEGRLVLDEERANQLANALRVAAERYADDAKVCHSAGHEGLALQFKRQEEHTRSLADKLAELGFC